MAYAENIKNGFLFFTLSATNLYQYNLQSYMPYFNKYKATNKAWRRQITS